MQQPRIKIVTVNDTQPEFHFVLCFVCLFVCHFSNVGLAGWAKDKIDICLAQASVFTSEKKKREEKARLTRDLIGTERRGGFEMRI